MELTTKSKKLVSPGRGWPGLKPRKKLSAKATFKAVCKAYSEVASDHLRFDTHAEGGWKGDSQTVALAIQVRDAMLAGKPPQAFDRDVEAIRWRLLADVWAGAHQGATKAIRAGELLGVKIARWWVAQFGDLGALQALEASWLVKETNFLLARHTSPTSPGILCSGSYLERSFAAEALARELRKIIAGAPDPTYEQLVVKVKELVANRDGHLRTLAAFLIPSDAKFARQVRDELHACTEPVHSTYGFDHFATTDAKTWPRYASLLAWSFETPKDFEQFVELRQSAFRFDARVALAWWTKAPDSLPSTIQADLTKGGWLA